MIVGQVLKLAWYYSRSDENNFYEAAKTTSIDRTVDKLDPGYHWITNHYQSISPFRALVESARNYSFNCGIWQPSRSIAIK